MIVFGWGSGAKEMGAGFLTNCTNCNNTSRFVVVESSKNFTLYWVPVAKWSKQYFYVCPICSSGVEVLTRELAQRIIASAFRNPTEPDPSLIRDLQAAMYRADSNPRTAHAAEREAASGRKDEERARRASEERGSAGQMPLHECYKILEVATGSHWEDIKKAYRLQISVWHPDRFEMNSPLYAKASERTKAINAAYSRLEEIEQCKRAALEHAAAALRDEEERARMGAEERAAAVRRSQEERERKAAETRAADARRAEEERERVAAEERAAVERQQENEQAQKAAVEHAETAHKAGDERPGKSADKSAQADRRGEQQVHHLRTNAGIAARSAKTQSAFSATTAAILIALFAFGLSIVVAARDLISRNARLAAAPPRDMPLPLQREMDVDAPGLSSLPPQNARSAVLPRTHDLALNGRPDLNQIPPTPSRPLNVERRSPSSTPHVSPPRDSFTYRLPRQPTFSARPVERRTPRPDAFGVGLEHFWAKRFTLSTEAFQSAQRLQPSDAAIVYFLALSQFRSGALDAARESVRAAVVIEHISPLADYYELMERVQGPMRTWLESERAIATKSRQ